jgi:hypothetical protein
MDVTREVLTAAPAPNAEGTAAPLNQLAKMPHYVSPYFTNVVRISLNSLWTTGWLDLDAGPMIISVPDTKGRYYAFSVMNMLTDAFASIGKRTTGTGPGAFLIAGPNWTARCRRIRAVYRSSTRYAWVLAQTQANGPGDFAAVNALMSNKFVLSGAILLLAAATAAAQINPAARQVLGACKPDIARLCRQVPPGQGRIKACMKVHLQELSEPCKEAMFQFWLQQ